MDDMGLQTRDGRTVCVKFDWDDQVEIFDANGAKIGNLDHRPVDEDDSAIVLITNIYLEGPNGTAAYKGQGVMGSVIRELVDAGYTLLVRHHDGIVREDGSHLTQDAPSFFNRLEDRGLVARYDGP
jgi:hypothetical protein